MAERRMLLNSTESFVGTMRIEYYCENGKLYLNLNDNIKIIEEHFDGDEYGYYIVGFKKDLIVHEDFINYNGYCEILLYSSYNIIFDIRSIYIDCIQFFANFTFNKESIISSNITLYDHIYIFNNNCFDIDVDGIITFSGKIKQQYYKNTNNCKIYAYPHILYDLMKYNVEENNEEAQNYIISNNIRLIISSPTEYITTIPNVDLGDDNHIKSVSNYMYEGNYITEYKCSGFITHLRKGITLPKDATVYFPDTVTDIDSDTFKNESNLKKVIIFGNCDLTYLDGFYSSGLKNIEIYSDKIEIIKESCFAATKLNTINISKSVKYIKSYAFDHIDPRFIINYNGTINEWNSINLDPDWMGDMQKIKVICTDGIIIETPNTPRVNEIYYKSTDGNIINVNTYDINNELLSNTYEDRGELVFRNVVNEINILFRCNTQLTKIWLPNHNITNTSGSFNTCTNLTHVNNSERLRIEEDIFNSCINLKQIEIDSDWIGDFAFKNCTSLNYVKISKRIESISSGAFKNCTSLNYIDYEGTMKEWNNIDIDSNWCDGSAIKTIHCVDGDIQL